jgi:hypothetical protein
MTKRIRKVVVTERAILARVNRKLADDETVRKSRTARMRLAVGEFYQLDLKRNCIVGHDLDLAELAKKLGVLKPWEEVAKA